MPRTPQTSRRRHTMINPEIAASLQAGGLAMNSREPANMIGSVLTEGLTEGRCCPGRPWHLGLVEWYPNRSFKKKASGKRLSRTVRKPDARGSGKIVLFQFNQARAVRHHPRQPSNCGVGATARILPPPQPQDSVKGAARVASLGPLRQWRRVRAIFIASRSPRFTARPLHGAGCDGRRLHGAGRPGPVHCGGRLYPPLGSKRTKREVGQNRR